MAEFEHGDGSAFGQLRITEEAKALAGELVKDLTARDGHPWSQADLVEEAISVLARSIGKVTT